MQSEEVKKLRAGNTDLISALMGMVAQYFDKRDDAADGVITHSFMSSEEEAIQVLIDAGFAKEVKGGYLLDWQKLNQRQQEHTDEFLGGSELTNESENTTIPSCARSGSVPVTDSIRTDAPSRRDLLKSLQVKRGMGACICEGQEIEAALNEIEELRDCLRIERDAMAKQMEAITDAAHQLHIAINPNR